MSREDTTQKKNGEARKLFSDAIRGVHQIFPLCTYFEKRQ